MEWNGTKASYICPPIHSPDWMTPARIGASRLRAHPSRRLINASAVLDLSGGDPQSWDGMHFIHAFGFSQWLQDTMWHACVRSDAIEGIRGDVVFSLASLLFVVVKNMQWLR